jgi:serine phosphatase RsbU (regulator of sigma subunit)/CBS domain-containing protein
MEQPPAIIPHLQEIARAGHDITPTTKVKEVVEMFHHDQSLLALPVADQGKFQGIISRKALFFHHLARPFAMELYSKTPIQELMEGDPVVMTPELDVNSALARLLDIDPLLETDAFPVVTGERCIGMVSVSDLMMRISECQAQLLKTLHSLSARIREEVTRASKIQQDLLPPAEFRFGPITVGAEIRNSSEIGGDLYDYFPIGTNRLGLVVADVSGHGVQSGMVTTAAKASLHALINQGITTPAELLHGMNNAILATARQTLLMTCLVAVIDLERGELVLANAGHNFPYHYRQGTGALEMLKDVAGYPLGFEPDCRYQEFSTQFTPGDTLVLYTDGIVECTAPHGEEFGYDRLEAFLREHIHLPPKAMERLLLETAARFSGGESFDDDVTLLTATSDEAYHS